MAEEVGQDDPVAVIEPVDEVGPVGVGPEQPVHEEHGVPAAAVDIGQRVAVQ